MSDDFDRWAGQFEPARPGDVHSGIRWHVAAWLERLAAALRDGNFDEAERLWHSRMPSLLAAIMLTAAPGRDKGIEPERK